MVKVIFEMHFWIIQHSDSCYIMLCLKHGWGICD